MQTIPEMIKGLGKLYKEDLDPAQVQAYLERLRDYPYSTVKAAVDNWIDTQQWFPKINQLLDEIKRIESSSTKPILVHCAEGGRLRELCLQAGAEDYWNCIWTWDAHLRHCGVCHDYSRYIGKSKELKKYVKEVVPG